MKVDPPVHVICDAEGCRSMAVGEEPPEQWQLIGWEGGRGGRLSKRFVCPRCARTEDLISLDRTMSSRGSA